MYSIEHKSVMRSSVVVHRGAGGKKREDESSVLRRMGLMKVTSECRPDLSSTEKETGRLITDRRSGNNKVRRWMFESGENYWICGHKIHRTLTRTRRLSLLNGNVRRRFEFSQRHTRISRTMSTSIKFSLSRFDASLDGAKAVGEKSVQNGADSFTW